MQKIYKIVVINFILLFFIGCGENISLTDENSKLSDINQESNYIYKVKKIAIPESVDDLEKARSSSINGIITDNDTQINECNANLSSEALFEDLFVKEARNDREWDIEIGKKVTVRMIEEQFNKARENDPTINKRLVMPSQEVWDMFSDSQKALFLINSERCARGIREFEGIDTTIVLAPAQSYADFLKVNNAWGHTEDGRTPWQRLEDDAKVITGENADFFRYGENLASIAYGSTGNYLEVYEPVAASVYGWLYSDKRDTHGNYGHRKFLLATGLKENFGKKGSEGLIGVGVAVTRYREDGFNWTKVYTVLNGIDPNENWENSSNIIRLEK